MGKTSTKTRETTPVDDVRRVRRRLSREAGGSIHALMEASRRAAEQYRGELGLQPAAPAPRGPRQGAEGRTGRSGRGA